MTPLQTAPPRSLTGKQWILRRESPLAPGQNIAEVLALERGISSQPGRAGKLSDPFLFPEMQQAVGRIERALKGGEKVGIFGDYDADGITGTLQLIRYFRRRGIEPETYLPDRLTEGYGLKLKSIEYFREKGVTLLLTVDTGITAHTEIAAARAAGIDVIVTDHHRVRGGRPGAYAVLHPEVPFPFPNPHLSGSGVAFMLVRALEHLEIWEGIEEDAVLATIGTIGDLVPLTGENRVLVYHGLKLMLGLKPGPLRELIESVQSPGRPLTSGDIAFRVVPRINAAGRLEHPSLALLALLHGGAALERLHELNSERRTMVEDLTELALSLVDRHQLFLTLRHTKFTPGVVGLIAGRLTELFGRPALVASIEGDTCVGSIRGIPSLDIMECLEHPAVRPHLFSYGGHTQAAGCTLSKSAFDALAAGLWRAMLDRGMNEETLVPTLFLDGELPEQGVGMDFARHLSLLEPFGKQNEEPIFLLRNRRLTDVRAVGARPNGSSGQAEALVRTGHPGGRHLQCRIGGVKAIGFGLGRFAQEVSSSTPLDIVCKVAVSTWNGREQLEYQIQDIRKCKM
ncbi:MAG: DHH family phosphoesterase [Candidatus Peribacteraceae bacterium]